MLRVRIDGGQLSTEQLRAIADISTEFARDTADVTDRQNIQLHWIRDRGRPGDLAAARGGRPVHHRGLRRHPARDPRLPRGRHRRRRDHRRHARRSTRSTSRYIGVPEFSNLPRKFKTAISGSPLQDVAHEVNDVSFVGVVHPEHGPGFDLWVGGGLSTNPMLAQRLGAWVPLDEVPDVWAGVIGVFRDYGYRRLRHPGADQVPAGRLGGRGVPRGARDRSTSGAPLRRRARSAAALRVPATTSASTGRRTAGTTSGWRRPSVGSPAPSLSRLADLAEAHGSQPGAHHAAPEAGRARRPRRPGRLPGRRGWRRSGCGPAGDVPPQHDGLHRHRVLQARDRRDQGPRPPSWSTSWSDGCPDFDEPLTINVNGCPNSCARIQVADIGLKGQLVPDADGNQVEGFQVHLGGGLGLDAGFGRKLRGHKVTADELPDYVERVVAPVRGRAADGERFAQWVGPRGRGGAAMSDDARGARSTARSAASEDLRPARGRARRLAVPRLHPRLHASRSSGLVSGMSAATPAGRLLDVAGRATPSLLRAPLALAAGRVTLEDAPRGGDHRVGGRRRSATGSAVDVVDGRRRARRTSSPRSRPAIDVLFLDTGYHFAETIGDPRRGRPPPTPVNIVNVTPAADRRRAGRRATARGCTAATPTCAATCARSSRWTAALGRLRRLGHRRCAGTSRRRAPSTPVVDWDARSGKVKVNPLARWTEADVDAYIERARHPGQPAAARRVRLDRLRAVHPAGRRRARTPAAAAGPARARPSAASTRGHR